MKIPQFLVGWSCRILTKALRDDAHFYYAYQANIAVAFQDEMAKENPYKAIFKTDIHGISNRAAMRFLDLWTKPPAKRSGEGDNDGKS